MPEADASGLFVWPDRSLMTPPSSHSPLSWLEPNLSPPFFLNKQRDNPQTSGGSPAPFYATSLLAEALASPPEKGRAL